MEHGVSGKFFGLPKTTNPGHVHGHQRDEWMVASQKGKEEEEGEGREEAEGEGEGEGNVHLRTETERTRPLHGLPRRTASLNPMKMRSIMERSKRK